MVEVVLHLLELGGGMSIVEFQQRRVYSFDGHLGMEPSKLMIDDITIGGKSTIGFGKVDRGGPAQVLR